MKKNFSSLRAMTALSVVAGMLLSNFASSTAQAAIDTWTGGGTPDGNWQTAANWGGVAPGANDQLNFAGSTQLLTTNNFGAGFVVNNIGFSSGAGAFSLSGNNLALTVFTNGTQFATTVPTGGSITNASSNPETIALPITLSSGRHTITTTGGGQLNLNGAVTRDPGAVVVFNPASGNINVTGGLSTNGMNNILGGWATLGNDWATLDANSNVVAYTGYTDINGGLLVDNPSSNVRYLSDNGNITNTGGIQINSLLTQQGANRFLTNRGVLKLGSNGGIYRLGSGVMTIGGGTIVANGGGELTFYDSPFNSGSGNNLAINCVISNDTPNVVSMTVEGYVAFGNFVNRHSGGTYINQGRVQAGNVGTFGTGPVYVYPGGQAFPNANGTYTNDFFISGIGTPENNGLGAIRINNAARIISGKVTLMGDAAIGGVGGISGPITGPGTLYVGYGANNNGHGTWQLGGAVANDYAGDTIINGTGSQNVDTLQINSGANSIMPHGAGKGNLILNAGSATARAIFDLNGTTQTINGLTNTATSPANDLVTSVGSATLILGDGDTTSTFAGSISNAVAVTKIGNGTQTLTGVNGYVNGTTVSGGTLIFGPGALPAAIPSLTVNGNGTLDLSVVTPITLLESSTMSMSNGKISFGVDSLSPAITVSNLIVGGSTNKINVTTVDSISTYPAQFTAIKYSVLNGTPNFGIGSLPASPIPYVAFVSNNVANGSIDVVITGGPSSIKWSGYSGGANNSTWDIASTPNWKTSAGVATTYTDGLFAVFDNSASNGLVTLAQDVAPSGVTVTNSVLTYTINGGNKIGGAASLTKRGTGALILDNSGVNDFSGGVFIESGTLQIGNNDNNGNLPAGGNIQNDGALVFARGGTVSVPNDISGSGSITQRGGGTLNLGGANSLTGSVLVTNNSTLQLGSSAAFQGVTTIANGSMLDLNGFTAPGNIIAQGTGVGGQGAINNSSGTIPPNFIGLTNLTLTGDTTLGTTGNRWDLRSPGSTTGDPRTAILSTGGHAYNLTKVGGGGTAFFGIVSATVDPMLADINVNEGTFAIQGNTTGLGDPTKNLNLAGGATFQLFAATNQVNKVIVMNDNATIQNASGNNTIIGPMQLSGACNFNIGATSLTLNNVLTGDGILYKITGTNTLNINGNSPDFAGGIYINSGTILLNGVMNNGLGVQINLGQLTVNGHLLGLGVNCGFVGVLAGTGVIDGASDISGSLLPGTGGSIGTLTFSNNLTLESFATMPFDLNESTTPGGSTNDLIVVNGDLIVNGGTINVNPIGRLTTGVPYRLFNYTGSLNLNASFTVPASGGYTFTIDTSTAHQVNLVVSGGPPVWNGGSSIGNNWSDSNNWSGVTVTANSLLYFSGNNRVNNTNDLVADTSLAEATFLPDAGSFILNGNSIIVTNVVNNSPNAQTINLGLDVNNNNLTLDGASGSLIVAKGITNISGTTRTITLAGSGILTNLLGSIGTSTNILSMVTTGASWTLVDNASSIAITNPAQLDIQAGTFNFGNGSDSPQFVSATTLNSRIGVLAGAPATLNMKSGTLTISARLNTGGGGNAIATINQTGGTIQCLDLLQCSDSAATAFTTINVTGGLLDIADPGGPNNWFLASRGTGVVSIASGAMINCAVLDLSRNAAGNSQGSMGVVNLNGGTLAATRVGTATSSSQAGPPTTGINPSATFNFNGGTLKANASSTTFFQGSSAPAIPIISIVKAGGAIIDTTNFNISVLEPLQHDSSLGGTADGGLIKIGTGTLTLTAASTYTGPTVVSNGTLTLNGSLGNTAVTVANGGTLAGTGSSGSGVIVSPGGSISPAGLGTIGKLTIAGNLVSQGTVVATINATSSTNDLLQAANITYGGTLFVTNMTGTLTASQSFKLFNATTYSGGFTNITPEIPGVGLAWDTNTLNSDGVLRMISTVVPTPNIVTTLNGNVLTLTWPPEFIGIGWHLQVQTNGLNVGIATNWIDVPGSGAVNSNNVTINPANGAVFYRLVNP